MSSAKKFVSEAQIAADKERLQRAWDATRGPDDPAEAPEAPHDSRTLFQRLEENRVKKQEEYEEAHRLKNMVKGLEDDDLEFLSAIDKKKMEDEKKVKEQERLELEEFRKRRAELDFAATAAAGQAAAVGRPAAGNPQRALLLAAVKPAKRARPDDSSPPAPSAAAAVNANGSGNLPVVGCLPGMGNYTDSSASSSSSDSEPDNHNMALHSSRRKRKNKNQQCSH